jgi:hypothetical protein
MYNSDRLEQVIHKAYKILDISFYSEILVHINVHACVCLDQDFRFRSGPAGGNFREKRC